MVIGIDGSEAQNEKRVGVSEYAYNFIHALYRISNKEKGENKYIIFLKDSNISALPPERDDFIYKIIPGNRFWIFRNLLPSLYKEKNIDVFFTPTHYLPLFTPIPQVCTIHDLGYLMFSEQFKKYDFWQLKYWTAISLYISKYIISVSETTKKDIVRHYKYSQNKIEVVEHGINHDVFNRDISNNLVRQVKNKYKIRDNYILYVGTLKPSKNIEGTIKAFSKFLSNNQIYSKDYQLVIAGRKGWLYEKVFETVKNENLEDKVIFTDYISLEDKLALYKGARFLISPSFWEGFGMHVLEAMACGTPVLVSSEGSLPEVAGECGIYVDPYNINDISKGIAKLVMMNKTEYNKLSDSCYKRSLSYSWEKTVKKTLKVLNKSK